MLRPLILSVLLLSLVASPASAADKKVLQDLARLPQLEVKFGIGIEEGKITAALEN